MDSSTFPITVRLLTLAAGLALAGPVLAQSEAPLGGPAVKERTTPGAAEPFGSRETGKLAQRDLPHRAFMEALRSSVGPEGPEGVRLSAEQQGRIRTLDRAYAEEVRTFMQANPEAADLMRREQRGRAERENKKNPQAPGEMNPDAAGMQQQDAPSKDEMQALRERAEELRSRAPKPGDVRAKIWTVLSEPQQAAVQAKIDAMREQMRERENELYVKKRVQQKQGEPGAAAAPDAKAKPKGKKAAGAAEPASAPIAPAAAPRASELPPAMRERVLRLFERLTPQQREELLRRVEQRLEGAAKAEKGAGASSTPAPASMDEVKVPEPEAKPG